MSEEQTYVDYIVKPLIKNPQALLIKRSVDDLGVLLTISVAQGDMGVLIGKEGATSEAIKQLVRVLGFAINKRISVKIEKNV